MPSSNNIGIRPAHLTRALISQLNGVVIEVRPGFGANEIDRAEKKIVAEYEFRNQQSESRKPNVDGTFPAEWLRATLYGVILAWLDHDDRELLEARIPPKLRDSKAIAERPAKMFHQMIAAVLTNHTNIITASERARLAEPMWYAFRHYIPPELLLGFNHQYAAHRPNDPRSLNGLEPSLTGWIKEQRLYVQWRGGELDYYRGDYPPDIVTFAEDVVKSHF